MPEQDKALQSAQPPETDQQKLERLLTEVVNEAQQGDLTSLQTLKGALSFIPGAQEQVNTLLGNAAHMVRRSYVDFTLGSQALRKDAVLEQTKRLEQELAGPNPSALERLLCERVATCWLALNMVETLAALNDKSLQSASYFEQRLEGLHKRYMAALVALARVRRLQVITPILAQVNIGEGAARRLLPDNTERE